MPPAACSQPSSSHNIIDGIREARADYLLGTMQTGSMRAKLLKLGDRISNLTAPGFVHGPPFVCRYVPKRPAYILPYAEAVNPDMHIDLSDLAASRESASE